MTEQTNDGRSHTMPANHDLTLGVAFLAFTAALAGTAVGFVAALAIALPVVSHDVAAQTKVLNQRLADVGVQSDTATACMTAGATGAAQVLGASMPEEQSEHLTRAGGGSGGQQSGQGGSGGQGGAGNQTFVSKLVTGSFARAAAAISDTGPHSVNEISAQNNANTSINTNTNIEVNSSTSQTSSSGGAKVADTTSGGSAATGDATNNATNSFNVTAGN